MAIILNGTTGPTFDGTGQRITGDFTNDTIANRVLFQTSTTNGETNIGIIPNGTANLSGLSIYSTSDPTNASRLRINVNSAATGINISSGAVGTGTNLPLRFQIGATNQASVQTNGDFQFNSGYGSMATAYGCRAWVNFNGTGTVAIRASGNVSSITDNGAGNFTVNLTTAMPDTNYSAVFSAGQASNVSLFAPVVYPTSTSAIQVWTAGGSNFDSLYSNFALFR